ncbi:MAG: acylphosphatase [Ignavibacteria bacterium]|nr:acylphosphatase [Ignavibacteria bacterium]
MEPTFVRIRIIVGGIVQGVGFRNYVFHWAKKLGVHGITRNLPTGQVESILEGETEKVESLVRLIKHGPKISEVTESKIEEEKFIGEFMVFKILR